MDELERHYHIISERREFLLCKSYFPERENEVCVAELFT